MWFESSQRPWMRCLFLLFATRLFAILSAFVAAPAFAENAAPCSTVEFEGDTFTACTADPRRHDIRLYLKRDDGTLYGALTAMPQEGLLFATNAGMFTPEHLPAGLYVAEGRQATGLNTVVKGYGNFHMQPNGVFWVKDGTAAVTTTQAYAKLKPSPDLATQSGPMLVIGNRVNPKFEANGASRYVRNGVGVDRKGRVVVAISDGPVSFGRFGRLFQDALRCPNALYLDGSVSRLRVGGQAFDGGGRMLGPLLGVYERAR